MLKNITTWYKAIPGYTIWILLVLFYFTTGAQISTLRGIYHALVLTSLQAIMYHVNLHRILPKYYDHQKNKFHLANIGQVEFVFLVIVVFGQNAVQVHMVHNGLERGEHQGVIDAPQCTDLSTGGKVKKYQQYPNGVAGNGLVPGCYVFQHNGLFAERNGDFANSTLQKYAFGVRLAPKSLIYQ